MPLPIVDAESNGGVFLGRPDFGAIFRAFSPPPPPGAWGAAGAREGYGTAVFACGPAGMTREVQVLSSCAPLLSAHIVALHAPPLEVIILIFYFSSFY